MADGVENEEISSLNDDPGSMSAKLARMAEIPVKEEAQPETDANDAQTTEATAATEVAAAKTDTGTAEEAAAESAAAEGTEKADPGAAEPKYASIEAATRAANEAATRMHTATTETATERKAREAAEAKATAAEEKAAAAQLELDNLKATQEAQRLANEAAKSKPKLKEKYAEALKKIQSIKLGADAEGNVVYPPDYDDQVADAWAGTGVDPEVVAKEAARIARAEIARENAAEAARIAAIEEATVAERVRADAEKLANSKFGLDMTKGSADYRLFYSHVDELAATPEHEMRGKPFEEQVAWAAGEVRKAIVAKIEMTDAERAAAAQIQQNNTVLERGVTRQALQEAPRQRTMDEIITTQSARR